MNEFVITEFVMNAFVIKEFVINEFGGTIFYLDLILSLHYKAYDRLNWFKSPSSSFNKD
jgi:hypothetical protein